MIELVRIYYAVMIAVMLANSIALVFIFKEGHKDAF